MQGYILRASMLKQHEYIWKNVMKKIGLQFVRIKCIMCDADKTIEVNSYMDFSKRKNKIIQHIHGYSLV